MTVYEAVKELIWKPDTGSYTAFGILGKLILNGMVVETVFIPNVFLDSEAARRFANTCNKSQLSILHLSDTIEDVVQTI